MALQAALTDTEHMQKKGSTHWHRTHMEKEGSTHWQRTHMQKEGSTHWHRTHGTLTLTDTRWWWRLATVEDGGAREGKTWFTVHPQCLSIHHIDRGGHCTISYIRHWTWDTWNHNTCCHNHLLVLISQQKPGWLNQNSYIDAGQVLRILWWSASMARQSPEKGGTRWDIKLSFSLPESVSSSSPMLSQVVQCLDTCTVYIIHRTNPQATRVSGPQTAQDTNNKKAKSANYSFSYKLTGLALCIQHRMFDQNNFHQVPTQSK